ncbi:MAG TPA: acyl-CoA thioester hydrolase/BAAT C-terminal domain-containing protein [Allosphingosinicella sp.]|nr:acyl-CoA thioester hydrolase/BAAT C-terminal domain-containing protein [Allosphingosinicella sp.]
MSGIARLLLAVCIVIAASPAFAQEPAVQITLREAGIAARFYPPAGGTPSNAAVLMLNGSDGGYPSAQAASDLAAAGHPVLAVAYASGFGAPIEGLPAQVANIDLAYVERAIDWLHTRVGRSRPVALMGLSRGAELALLVATRRADVAGVIAFSPSSVLWPGVGDASGRTPSWTSGGQPLPYVARPNLVGHAAFAAALADGATVRRAVIPAERIAGPILLISSRSDNIWPAAYMADRIEERLRRARFRHGVRNLQYDDASHLLMGPGPGMVSFARGDFRIWFGGTEAGTLAARAAAWAETRRFLAALGARR